MRLVTALLLFFVAGFASAEEILVLNVAAVEVSRDLRFFDKLLSRVIERV